MRFAKNCHESRKWLLSPALDTYIWCQTSVHAPRKTWFIGRCFLQRSKDLVCHYNDVIMSAMASQITSLTIVYSIVNSNADQRKHQSSASLAFFAGNSPVIGKFPTQRARNAEMFSFDDVTMWQMVAATDEQWHTFIHLYEQWLPAFFLIFKIWVEKWRLYVISMDAMAVLRSYGNLPCPRLVQIGSILSKVAFTIPAGPAIFTRYCLTQWISKLPGCLKSTE